MSLIDTLRDKYIIAPIAKRLTNSLVEQNTGSTGLSMQTWQVPQGFNGNMHQQRKPGSTVNYGTLRNMARFHEISRACINIRKRQITQLSWDIVPREESNKGKFANEIPLIRAYFSTIGGYNMKMRKLLEMIVEDYLVIDGVALYKRRLNNGALIGLIPIDPTTIKLKVDSSGMTPLPPDAAYEQWLNGSKVADLTTDQLAYDILNPRTESPYGYSVMETLVMTIESAFKAMMYNAAYFTDGTLPEGFYELPKEWNLEQIKQFQEHFDAMLAGDSRTQRKIKFMPSTEGGKGFQPAKSYNFDALNPYLEWLMRVTASLFGVMPQELGYTDDVNRANAEEQTEITKRNSIRPLAMAISDLMNDLLWKEQFAIMDSNGGAPKLIGPFPELQFRFMDLDTKDELIDSQITERMVKIGAVSVDEWREDKGLKAIGLEHFVLTSSGPMLVKDIINGDVGPAHAAANPVVPVAPTNGDQPSDQNVQDAVDTTPQEDIKRWEKKALADLKAGRPFRKFESTVLDDYTKINLNHDLSQCTTREGVKAVFGQWRFAVEEGVTREIERTFNKLDTVIDHA